MWTHVGEQFASRTQHDAQEFLIFLLNSLSDELKQETSAIRHKVDSFDLTSALPPAASEAGGGEGDGGEGANDASVSERTASEGGSGEGGSDVGEEGGGVGGGGEAAAPSPTDIVRELFGCQLRQTVRCHNCGSSHYRSEENFGLQLTLPAHLRATPGK